MCIRDRSRAKIGVVFHTHYSGDDLQSMQALAGAKVKGSTETLVVNNDTPMHKVGLNHQEEVKFDKHVSDIEKMCRTCGDFLDELVGASGTKGDAKFHISSYLKQFFNNEIKNARSITNVDKSLIELGNFYHAKMSKELAKIKTPDNLVKKRNLVYQLSLIHI